MVTTDAEKFTIGRLLAPESAEPMLTRLQEAADDMGLEVEPRTGVGFLFARHADLERNHYFRTNGLDRPTVEAAIGAFTTRVEAMDAFTHLGRFSEAVSVGVRGLELRPNTRGLGWSVALLLADEGEHLLDDGRVAFRTALAMGSIKHPETKLADLRADESRPSDQPIQTIYVTDGLPEQATFGHLTLL